MSESQNLGHVMEENQTEADKMEISLTMFIANLNKNLAKLKVQITAIWESFNGDFEKHRVGINMRNGKK